MARLERRWGRVCLIQANSRRERKEGHSLRLSGALGLLHLKRTAGQEISLVPCVFLRSTGHLLTSETAARSLRPLSHSISARTSAHTTTRERRTVDKPIQARGF